MIRAILFVSLFCLAGCSELSKQRTPASLDEANLCEAWGNNLRAGDDAARLDALETEILRRNLGNPREWKDPILAKKVRVGMSRCGMYAAWGKPTRQNQTLSASGEHMQYIFGSYFFGNYISTRPNYVYTDNGTVSSIQQ